jgi:hypothetical protein
MLIKQCYYVPEGIDAWRLARNQIVLPPWPRLYFQWESFRTTKAAVYTDDDIESKATVGPYMAFRLPISATPWAVLLVFRRDVEIQEEYELQNISKYKIRRSPLFTQ